MGMLSIQEPIGEEISNVIENVKNGRELDDREIWIWKTYLE
jgi:hypothetical protein